jgi:hypothetical protein
VYFFGGYAMKLLHEEHCLDQKSDERIFLTTSITGIKMKKEFRKTPLIYSHRTESSEGG